MKERGRNRSSTIDRGIAFLNGIGIPTRYEPGATGFSEGVYIEQGELLVDQGCRVSVLLHEGAHLAITPRRYRRLMSGNLYAGRREMFRHVGEMGLPPDTPLYRAVLQSSDPEATAWAYAAGLHLGFSEEDIIQDDQYGGDGETIRLALSIRSYAGINGLAHAGFCALRPDRTLPVWPKLAFWTQEVDAEG
jgi:hypothetical protein